jgi:hypothetical protein
VNLSEWYEDRSINSTYQGELHQDDRKPNQKKMKGSPIFAGASDGGLHQNAKAQFGSIDAPLMHLVLVDVMEMMMVLVMSVLFRLCLQFGRFLNKSKANMQIESGCISAFGVATR